MKKVLLLVLLAGAGWWYFEGGRTMSEASVREHYDLQMEALTQFDSDYFCDGLAEDFRGDDLTFSSAGHRRTRLGKVETCDRISESLDTFRQLSEISGGRTGLSFSNRIESITLSDGDKAATVEGVSRVSIAGMVLAKSNYTEELIRRNGRILSVRSKTKSWVYGR